jgi:WD40 repeat protein
VTYGIGTAIVDLRTREIVARVVLPLRNPDDDFPAMHVASAAWTPDGSRLLLGAAGEPDDDQYYLVVVDTGTWQPVGQVDTPSTAQVMEWSPDDTLLALGMESTRQVVFLDRDLEHVRTVPVGDHPFDASFSPDGSRLAVGGSGGVVTVLDVSTGSQVHEPVQVSGAPVVDVEWRPDGSTVVASGIEDFASMYDVDRDLVRAVVLPATDTLVDGYAYQVPDTEGEVIVLDGEHPGRRYPLDPARWLATACEIAGRDLTRAEWQRYLPAEPHGATCSGLAR